MTQQIVYYLKPTRKKINSFLKLLTTRLNRRYHDDPTAQGYEIFQSWVDGNIQAIDNRYQLNMLLFDDEPDPKDSSQDTINKCLRQMRQMVTLINEEFDLQKSKNDPKVWTASTNVDKQN